MASSFTGTEELEIVNTYAEHKTDLNGNPYWVIRLTVKNTGSKPATIDGIFINDVPGAITNVVVGDARIPANGITVKPGSMESIVFIVTSTGTTIRGTTNRSRPDPGSGRPYISFYPFRIMNEPSTRINITISVNRDASPADNTSILVIDQNNAVVARAEDLTISAGSNTTTVSITTPAQTGTYIWKIEAVNSTDNTDIYDIVESTIIVVNPADPVVAYPFHSGVTVSIVIHTSSGGRYPATVKLP